jgi:hypothetical protein
MRTSHAVPRSLARLLVNSRPARLTAGGVALAVVAAGSLVWASPASAAVPAFPDNIVVFPDRDFVSIEGYEADAGKTMTVTVTRGGQVVGKGQGTIAAGGVALEVNHPGGVCWGTGPGAPNVTPDITAGDVVTIAVDGTPVGDSTSIDAAVRATTGGPAVEIDGTDPTILRIRGHVGPGVNTAQLEQRIIAPDLRTTVVARRDVRAIPGPRTTDPRGAYDSALEFTAAGGGGSDFVATYWFPTEEIAATAAAGGVRIMSWLVEDADANRQGLTISEFGEPGGPGFGGCPNGPSLSGPPAPVVQSLIGTSTGTGSNNFVFTWTPAVAVPGTPAITGYRVRAFVAPADVNGEQAEFGKRIGNPASTGTTLSLAGLPNGFHYEFEISSVNALGNETIPAVSVPLTVPDTTGPTVATSPSAALGPFFASVDVALASESGADLYYAVTPLGGTVPELYNGGLNLIAAIPYTGPIQLTATSTISVIGFDALGNVGSQTDTLYEVVAAAPAPDAPLSVTATGAERQATVSWPKVADPAGGPAVSGYTLAWTGPTTGSLDVPPTDVLPGDVFTKTVTGLSAGSYTFTVTARNAAGTSEATASLPVAVTEPLQVTLTQDRSSVRAATVSLTATSPNPGVTYTWTRVVSKTNPTSVTPSLLSATSGSQVQVNVPALTLPTGNLLQADVTTRNAPLFFRVTVSKPNTPPVSAVVQISITPDTTTITSARYRAGTEFRISGTESAPTATVRIYRKATTVQATTYVYVGTATVTAGTFDLRLRPPGFNLVPGEAFYAFSTLGGLGGPFTATIG